MYWKRQTALGALLMLLMVASFGLVVRQEVQQDEGQTTASITVVLPADAQLLFDGDSTQKTGSERTFTTPPLPLGKTLQYNVLARWTAAGKTVERTHKVVVHAGALVCVSYADAPRKVVLNNYTTPYVDLWVNGYMQTQIPPGGSKTCVIDQMINPTTLTAYGSGDDAVWGPRQVFGAFKTYTWNLQ